jgi:hypothetical protein
VPERWRTWTVTPAGELLSPYASLSPDPRYGRPWPAPPAFARAWCPTHRRPPLPQCECGIRGLASAADALAAAAMARQLDPDTWAVPWPACLQLVIAVGQVELAGRIVGPGASDPPRSRRAERARPVGTLYLTSADRLAAVAARYGLRVERFSALPAEARQP